MRAKLRELVPEFAGTAPAEAKSSTRDASPAP
jgi:hypothetical protein